MVGFAFFVTIKIKAFLDSLAELSDLNLGPAKLFFLPRLGGIVGELGLDALGTSNLDVGLDV